MEKIKVAIYPGSFDPVTNGHLDTINRALKIVDKLIIAVLDNPSKKPLFSREERIDMLKEVTKNLNVEIDHFDGLLVDYARKKKCDIIIRSLRAVSDFDSEFQMSVMNRKLNKNIETVFLMTDNDYFYLNSTMVKDIARNKGRISCLVPKVVEERLRKKFG